MDSKAITILNDHPFGTGLGRYAETLYSSISEISEICDFDINFYSVSIGYTHSISSYPGRVIFSKFDSFLNEKFPYVKNIPDISHFVRGRFLKHFILKNSDLLDQNTIANSLIHYTNPGIFPIKINSRTIVTIHDVLFLKKHSLKNSLGDTNNKRYLGLFKNAPYIITFTNVVKDELEDLGFTSLIEIIPPSISDKFYPILGSKNQIRSKLGLPMNKILVLSVSSNRPGKNLKAIEEVMDVLGNGYQLVRVGAPLGRSITFAKVSDETLNEIYNACDVLLFPSTEEGVGLPVLEAFASGLPVVVSDIDVMREICKDAALLSKPEKLALVSNIKYMIENKEYFIKKGLSRSLEFKKGRFIKEMSSYYDRVLTE